MKVRYRINGKEVSPQEFRAHKMPVVDCGGPAVQGYSEGKPGRSLAMGCHRSQIGLLNSEIERHGIQGVKYVEDRHGGKCEITSRRGRAKWMPIFGQMHGLGALHDDDGGYGDG